MRSRWKIETKHSEYQSKMAGILFSAHFSCGSSMEYREARIYLRG
jgi:hypothetical protein